MVSRVRGFFGKQTATPPGVKRVACARLMDRGAVKRWYLTAIGYEWHSILPLVAHGRNGADITVPKTLSIIIVVSLRVW